MTAIPWRTTWIFPHEMGETASVRSRPCRHSVRLPWQLAIALVAVVCLTVFSISVAVASDLAEDDVAEDESPPDEPVADDEETVPAWITDASVSRHNLDMLLRRRFAFVDRTCGLTDAQKQKLELVLRGDLKRSLDRIDEIETKCRLGQVAPDEVKKLSREVRRIETGASTENSLLAKVVQNFLTPEQRERYEPLRKVIHVGGRIERAGPESRDVVEIDVHGTSFTDDDSAHFGNFPCLLRLFLAGTQVTDVGLAHLQGLTKLEWLDLGATGVTDTGLAHLQVLTKLHWLSLDSTSVSDEGLTHLMGLTRLQALHLENTKVTDAGLVHLHGLTRLERLYLNNTQVSEAGIARLQRALPKLTIQVQQSRFHGLRQMGGGCCFF